MFVNRMLIVSREFAAFAGETARERRMKLFDRSHAPAWERMAWRSSAPSDQHNNRRRAAQPSEAHERDKAAFLRRSVGTINLTAFYRAPSAKTG